MKAVSIIKSNENDHTWSFSRVGGVNRVNLETGEDLINLENLDQKLWTALSCPVHGLEIDNKTLELIDTDNDDRIRVPEVMAAVKWLTSIVKDPDDLVKEHQSLELSSINDSTEEGRTLLDSARQILKNLGKPEADSLTVEETSDTVRIFADTRFNGDGIITEYSANDESIKKLIADIISCVGSVADRSGKEGISITHINDFYQHCEDYSNWYKRAENDLKEILPFGDGTIAAYNALVAVKGKIEDYFLRCRLTEYDPESTEVLNALKSGYESITTKDLSSCLGEIASFPLSAIDPDQILSFSKGINPAWEKSIETFKSLVVNSLFSGKESLTRDEFDTICRKFDDFTNWQSEKRGAAVEKLGLQMIREILSGKSKEELNSLIAQDKALESNANNIFLVDKLVRYYRDVFRLLRNYVTFYDFYSPGEEAIFQAGRLYFDQRCCELCMVVRDMSKHNALARTSGLFLAYCECSLKRGNEKMLIVAAFTDGDFDNIDVGRNGIFYDRKGRDWDATIIKIIDNPISIRQAFWSPYRKVSKFIINQVKF